MAERSTSAQLLLSLISAADTNLVQVSMELRCDHDIEHPDDVMDALACGIIEQARTLRALLQLYAERKTALDRQRRR